MKKLLFLSLLLFTADSMYAQLVARVETKKDIPGICDMKEIYALFPSFKGQEEAVSETKKEDILKRLNAEVNFLKDKPKYKDKGMIGIFINCKGEMVHCEMDNKTKSPELDSQIVAVFKTLGKWKPGKLNGKEVDTSLLFSFTIKKGVFSFGS